ncbi:MAG: carbonic anhydrase [Candidatus Komeilibacteria bacterium]
MDYAGGYWVRVDPRNFAAHTCEAAAISCVDFRFRVEDQRFLEKHFGTPDFDLFRWPGPARSMILDPRFKDRLVEQIRNVCVNLHQVKWFVVLGHWDCGAYGGSAKFSSPKEEEAAYVRDLAMVRLLLQGALPGVAIEVFYSKLADGKLYYFSC